MLTSTIMVGIISVLLWLFIFLRIPYHCVICLLKSLSVLEDEARIKREMEETVTRETTEKDWCPGLPSRCSHSFIQLISLSTLPTLAASYGPQIGRGYLRPLFFPERGVLAVQPALSSLSLVSDTPELSWFFPESCPEPRTYNLLPWLLAKALPFHLFL
jgi:hypothetical protein